MVWSLVNSGKHGLYLKTVLAMITGWMFLLLVTAVRADTTGYQYDSDGRLVRVTKDNGLFYTFAFDSTGNIVSEAIDRDSDGDGLPDSVEEAWGCLDPQDADSDDDGIPDGTEDANQNGELDDGETHPCLLDSDGDGIQDGTELGYTLDDIGPDTDINIFQPDLDPDTTTSPTDPDTDGDGASDGEEDANHNGRIDDNETDPNDPLDRPGAGTFYSITTSSGKTVIIYLK